jgi:hypothetical protein
MMSYRATWLINFLAKDNVVSWHLTSSCCYICSSMWNLEPTRLDGIYTDGNYLHSITDQYEIIVL